MSENVEHTPGPWSWHINTGLSATRPESLHGPNGEIVLSWSRTYHSSLSGNTVTSISNADAHLILFAPETAAERDELCKENAALKAESDKLIVVLRGISHLNYREGPRNGVAHVAVMEADKALCQMRKDRMEALGIGEEDIAEANGDPT